jgi:hypothetical protein
MSIDPNTEYKGRGKVIHKWTTVQMYYVNINNIKTKTCKHYKIKSTVKANDPIRGYNRNRAES